MTVLVTGQPVTSQPGPGRAGSGPGGAAAVMLRPMTRADLPAVLRLEHDLFGDEAWTEGMLAAELDRVASGRYYLVAEGPGGLVGYAGLLTPGGGQADVLTLAVAEDRWGQRIGATLLDALLAEAARRGCREVFLEVRADNDRAQRLYRRLGFTEIGIRRGYYQPSGTDALVMRRSAARGDPRDPPVARWPRRARTRRRAGWAGRCPMTAPLVLGIETSCDETGVGPRARARRCSPTPSPPASTSTPGSAGWCPRWRAARIWRPWCQPWTARWRTAGVKLAEVDAIAVTAGPGLAGALLVGVCRRQGLCARAWASRSTA